MKWYLAGPMSGIPDQNYPAFQAASESLRVAGYEIVSPHETYHHPTQPNEDMYCQLLRHDVLSFMKDCDGIILLPGWSQSRGAKLELHLALSLDLPVRFYRVGFAEDIS